MTRARHLLLVAVSALGACDGEGTSTQVDISDDASVDSRTPSPPDVNAPSGCTPGTLGCACGAGGGCALDPEGELLSCVAGLCLLPTCPSGELGCACRQGRCGEGACVGDVCVRQGCEPGSAECACASWGCEVGLVCKGGAVCVDSRGYEGGACLANGRCHEGNRCEVGQGLCVFCDRGTQGCACSAAGTCASGLLCVAGTCAAAADLPPTNPVCYTPCRRDLDAGQNPRACSADGLMPGCIDQQTCVDGSCLEPGQAKPTCASDVDCPFFQACLAGGCYSNCDSSVDCPSGLGCHQKVCRVPCMLGTGQSPCPRAMTCDSADGETGFCVPTAPADDVPAVAPTASRFTIEGSGTYDMSNLVTRRTLRITPEGGGTQRITVRKLAHELFEADGSRELIDTPVDAKTGEYLPCAGSATECPLWWLELSDGQSTTRGGQIEITCQGTCPEITLGNGGGSPGVRYTGRLLVTGPSGSTEVTVRYVEDVSGRWEGQVHYFTAFEDDGVAAWLDRADKSDVTDVRNALIQRWGAFRKGNLEGWAELEAVLTATRTGSWDQPRTRELCKQVTGGSTSAVCYPFTNPAGVRVYVDNASAQPVPSATTELPIALHLRARLDDPTQLIGRIDSTTALHYPNNPAVSLRLAADPARPGACDPRIGSACVVFVEQLGAEITTGARYPAPATGCAIGFAPQSIPWLIPGFTAGTRVDPDLGRATVECRDAKLPFVPTDEVLKLLDMDLARANPSPDGRVRQRTLELLDGALIDQTYLFLLVRESFGSFVPGQPPVSAYAFVTLKRTPADLADADYVGTPVPKNNRPDPTVTMSCSPALLAKLPVDVASTPDRLVKVLIDGDAGDGAAFALDPITAREDQIHYLCDGRMDGGGELTTLTVDPFDGDPPPGTGYMETDAGGAIVLQIPKPCLPGSEVVFFDTKESFTQGSILREACQADGTCRQTLDAWVAGGIATLEPPWRCEDSSRALCDVDLNDLREGKTFFRPRITTPTTAPLAPLAAAVDEAFRYKTRFQSRRDEDAEVGFAPAPCVPGSDAVPYCYDAKAIESIRDRVDCLVDIYANRIDTLSTPVRNQLDQFLRGNFAQRAGYDGFERLYTELLVMLGDEELTSAFASRFDLAMTRTRDFEGTALELDGINLTGVAGAEMERLYTATQYYEMTLDRLYRFGPSIAKALGRGDTSSAVNMISPQTVTLYLGRIVRASAQAAFAWSEIAKRYRDFNRADIARRVLERAYARTYMESVMLSRLMLDIADQTGASFKDQIVRELGVAQRTFRVALLDMREIFETIVRGATYFGFPPEYVPFPAVDTSSTSFGSNGFDLLVQTARSKLQTAKEREQIAFDSLTAGRLDSAEFQSELVRVKNNYEDQLATLCGVFTGDDGVTRPAIRRYADRSRLALVTGDPCALFGNGTIYEQMLEVDVASTALEGVLARYRNATAEIETERTRVATQCGLIREQAQFEYETAQDVRDAQRDMAIVQAALGGAVRLLTSAKEAVDSFSNCTTAFDPPSKAICAGLAGTGFGLAAAATGAEAASQGAAIRYQQQIATKQLETGRWVTERQCEAQLVDSAARMAGMIRGLDEIVLEALRAQIQLELDVVQVSRSLSEAQRLEERQTEAQQLLIDVEAAQNDPNVRIYRNEAVINADIAFEDAMRAAYRATRMYEYYTSTSYARLDELFLIRLASRGRPNLENYLTDLENAFADFEEQLGLPDARVSIVSLRDDILRIPYLDENKRAITQSDRIARMVAALEDPARLDKNGYIVLPFGTSVDDLSPLTRNHKIRYIEVNVVGSEIGDRLGRVYLRQRGTSILRSIDDRNDYYVFPVRTAVVDVFFNGSRVFPPENYQNLRLRDRPYAHTMWELIINRRDEAVNRDIDLGSLSDIQILIHYTDFTVF